MEQKTPEFDRSQEKGSLSLRDMKAVLVEPWAFAGGARSLVSSHERVEMPLFAKSPEVSDIYQQNIGDCWFLASLAAVLATPNGADRIQKSIKEIEHDKEVNGPAVIVRLFDINGQEHFIKLRKQVIEVWGRKVLPDAVYHAKLDRNIGCWPVFFEAACTAFDKDGQLNPKSVSYNRLQGGTAERGFRLLLGAKVEAPRIYGATSLDVLEDRESDSLMEPTRFKLSMLLSGGLTVRDREILTEIFGAGYEGLYETWNAWLEHWRKNNPGKDLWENLYKAIKTYSDQTVTIATPRLGFDFLGTNTTINAGKVFRREQFQKFYLETFGSLDRSVRAPIYGYGKHLFPGKRGTGKYNLYQKKLFALMEAKHSEGVPMVVSSNPKYVGRTHTDKVGPSAAEDEVKGLIREHAYVVLTVSKVPDGRRWIRLFNPWGRKGRASWAQITESEGTKHKYTLSEEGIRQHRVRKQRHPEYEQPPIPKGAVFEVEQAVFDLDLDDLTKRFVMLTYPTSD